MNPYKPVLKELTPFSTAIKEYSNSNCFISHCADDEKDQLFNVLKSSAPTSILIGPEGDFSQSEIEMAVASGWRPVSLGHQRFRTETAAVLAVHMFSLKQLNVE
jgi:16S rRNA (uracil1498-N3)-methyltransferase